MKFYKIIFVATLLLLSPQILFAQKQVQTERQIWTGFFNQTRLSNKWGIWCDLHARAKDNFVGAPALAMGRIGPMYYLSNDIRLTLGYSYVHHFPDEAHKNVAQPEHRPFQQVQWFMSGPKARLMQWVRLEERFRRKIKNDFELADGYNFNWRVRYNFALFLPLSKKGLVPGTLQFLLNDELHVNFGERIVFNYFDQNRLFGGLVYQVNKHAQIHLGYMNVFQQLSAGNRYRQVHSVRMFYFHNLDFRA